MHPSRRIHHATSSPTRSCTHVLYDLQTIGPYNDHSDLAQNAIPGQRSCPLIGQESNRRHPIQKHQITWIDHVVCRKSNLSLFISKFSNLAECTLVHWPSQQDMMDGSTVDTQKLQVIDICTGTTRLPFS